MNEMLIAACLKWTELRPRIDHLNGEIEFVPHGSGFSESDLAAVETALRLAEQIGGRAVAITVASDGCEGALRELIASGVDRVIRIDPDTSSELSSREVAARLAAVLGPDDLDVDLVVCGDVSADRGSGAVPAYLAHELNMAQALGLMQVTPQSTKPDALGVLRRLDGGRRERLRVALPAIISVEGSVANLRRASLSATLASRTADIDNRASVVNAGGGPVGDDHSAGTLRPPQLRPWRPRPRVLGAPRGDTALARIVELTGALVDRTPPRTVTLEPGDAAAAIIDQLVEWGYLSNPSGAEEVPGRD